MTRKRLRNKRKKSVYCKWKSTEILKAIKEGRTPTPGGYGEESVENKEENEDEGETEDENKNLKLASLPVETVEENSESDEMKEKSPALKMPIDGNDDGDDSGDDKGTEVQLGPPPAYPTGIEPVEPPIPPAPPMEPPLNIPKPPMTFNLPPPAPSASPPTYAPEARTKVEKPKKTFFGLGSKKKSNKKASKAEIADATELTRFALAALEDKDTNLAAQRLQQALEVLGR